MNETATTRRSRTKGARARASPSRHGMERDELGHPIPSPNLFLPFPSPGRNGSSRPAPAGRAAHVGGWPACPGREPSCRGVHGRFMRTRAGRHGTAGPSPPRGTKPPTGPLQSVQGCVRLLLLHSISTFFPLTMNLSTSSYGVFFSKILLTQYFSLRKDLLTSTK